MEKRHSPSPAPPQAQAPGIRANALQQNFDQALLHTLRVCSYPNFAACFPTPAEHVPEALRGLHREFVNKLERVCKTEFKALIEERSVTQGLNELDSLIIDARKRMERAKIEPSGNGALESLPTPHLMHPSALLQAHLSHFITSQTAELEVKREEAQQTNTDIIEEILVQRSTINGLITGVENLLVDLEGAAKALSGEETSRIEIEMQDLK